jgi:hypothetical protein
MDIIRITGIKLFYLDFMSKVDDCLNRLNIYHLFNFLSSNGAVY